MAHKWSAPWARVRRRVLARDAHECQIRGPRCTGRATTVDHIIPLAIAPELQFDESNLRASCVKCQYENLPTVRVIDVGRRPGW